MCAAAAQADWKAQKAKELSMSNFRSEMLEGVLVMNQEGASDVCHFPISVHVCCYCSGIVCGLVLCAS
jgi:hypothetical protein